MSRIRYIQFLTTPPMIAGQLATGLLVEGNKSIKSITVDRSIDSAVIITDNGNTLIVPLTALVLGYTTLGDALADGAISTSPADEEPKMRLKNKGRSYGS